MFKDEAYERPRLIILDVFVFEDGTQVLTCEQRGGAAEINPGTATLRCGSERAAVEIVGERMKGPNQGSASRNVWVSGITQEWVECLRRSEQAELCPDA